MSPKRASVPVIGLLLFAACGNGAIGTGQPGPCDVNPPAPECSQSCDFDVDCDVGFYCGNDGLCTADCTLADDQCPAGQFCDNNGRCIDDGAGPDAEDCPDVFVVVEPQTPTIWLVIDQSGSMTADFNGVSRWQAVTDALVHPTNGVVLQLQDRVIFGASLYTSNGGNAGGTCPILTEDPPSLNNYPDIDNLMRTNSPSGDTPTSESLDAVAAQFPLPDPERPEPRAILLATDGNPDNCADPDAHDIGSQMMSESSVQAAFAAGVNTYVLSVGDGVARTHLQRMANAGVGVDMDTGTEPFYVANSPAELVDAINEIIRGVRTCVFELDGVVDLNKACEGTVELNGTPLEYGVDWQMVDGSTLELLGAACDAFLETDEAILSAEFPCGAIVL